MKATEELPVGDRQVLVFDDALTAAQIAAVQALFVQIPFKRSTSFDGELNYGMTLEEFSQFPRLPALLDGLFDTLRARFDVHDPDVRFGHAYAAVFCPTDKPVQHTDGKTTQALTFLYYANPYWDPRWEGDTVFFDPDGNVAATVTPRPGRITVFPANILHRGGAPHAEAPLLRHTISAFYYAPPVAEAPAGTAP